MEGKKNPNYNSAVSNKNGKAAEDQTKEPKATLYHFGLLLVCFGIFCVLMAARIGVTIHMNMKMTKQLENIGNLTTQLIELGRAKDDLNMTLGFILKFDNLTVNDFCPDKKCQPCLKGWIIFLEKCYLFYNEMPPWKTWKESREFCQGKNADLVVIESLQEQEFVINQTKYYFDKYHGYWLGLQETNNTWIWVDGHEDTLRFWIKGGFGTPDPYALLIPGRNPTESWNKAENMFENKFICEREALF